MKAPAAVQNAIVKIHQLIESVNLEVCTSTLNYAGYEIAGDGNTAKGVWIFTRTGDQKRSTDWQIHLLLAVGKLRD